MNFLSLIAVICLATYANAQCTRQCGANQYQIRSGDTFYALGGNTWAGACAWWNANSGLNPCGLNICDCLNYPAPGTSTVCPASANNYGCYSGYNSNPTYYGSGYYGGSNYGTGTGTGYYGGSTYGTGTNPTGCTTGCGANQYQIKSGDTFYGLAGNNWGGACAWLNANIGVNPCGLQICQCVNYPQAGISTVCPASANTYGCYSGYNSNPSYSGSGYYGGSNYGTGTGTGYYGGSSYGTGTNPTGCTTGCGANQYQIKSGDTFYILGGNSWGGACAWWNANSGLNPCGLQICQCVNYPAPGTSTVCPASTNNYGCYNGYNSNPTYFGNGYYVPNNYGKK